MFVLLSLHDIRVYRSCLSQRPAASLPPLLVLVQDNFCVFIFLLAVKVNRRPPSPIDDTSPFKAFSSRTLHRPTLLVVSSSSLPHWPQRPPYRCPVLFPPSDFLASSNPSWSRHDSGTCSFTHRVEYLLLIFCFMKRPPFLVWRVPN